ncbi:MAG TPA: VOC family protein [Acidimicrobiales bacterium]|nr:VOC family protein [Acidimicrobiales bacterium]
MPEFSSFPPGTPSWVDLSTPDTKAAAAFYGSVFGWSATDMGPDAGGYAMFQKDGATVAGLGPTHAESQPPVWTTYIGVIDAEATVARAKVAGATVFIEPMKVLDAGYMAMFADPTGAVLGLWQPGQNTGVDVANEPGAWCWSELNTRDTDKASSFYRHVFDWSAAKSDAEGVDYVEWKRDDGATVGGMLEIPAMVPAEVPAHWLVYFAVDDTDATAAAANQLGAVTLVPPTDIAPGRFCILTDPAGAMFGIIKMAAAG